jgi:hypothetical protein
MNRFEFLRNSVIGIAGCRLASYLPPGALDYTPAKQGTNEPITYPLFRLNNGVMEVLVFPPDEEKGYYRGSRFDWSGIIAQVTCRGHTYFRPWQHSVAREVPPAPHNPDNPNDGTGTAEEFREPLGYNEAIQGGHFVKIGVGVLVKPDNKTYEFPRKYEIFKPGKWKVSHEDNRIKFEQKLNTDFGYAYQYTKTITLQPGGPGINLAHTLTNTGSKQITTSTYCHNFILLDGMPAGPGYEICFDSPVQASKLTKDYAAVLDSSIRIIQPIPEKGTIGAPVVVQDSRNNVEVKNHSLGTGIRISGTQPLASFFLWVSATAVCPEPMIEIDLKPGEMIQWENRYDFLSNLNKVLI